MGQQLPIAVSSFYLGFYHSALRAPLFSAEGGKRAGVFWFFWVNNFQFPAYSVFLWSWGGLGGIAPGQP